MPGTRRRNKIAIIGAGSVGATTAYAAQIRGVAQTINIYDLNGKKAHAEALDLNHGMQFTPMATIDGGDDIELLRDADVIVTTAGAKQKPGQTRMELAGTNVRMMQSLMPRMHEVAPDAIHLVVTNPCDVLTYAALKASGLPSNRVLGSGTVLDSSRLRFLLAKHCDVSVANVHASIVGEHGDSEFPVWSSATIAQIPVHEWTEHGRGRLTEADLERIKDGTVHAAYEIIQGKGATWYAVALAVCRILESILNDENRVMLVSSLLTDYKGVSDVCLSLPTIVNRQGVQKVLDVPMNEAEVALLHFCANAVTEVIRGAGL